MLQTCIGTVLIVLGAFTPLLLTFVPSRRQYITPGELSRSVFDDLVKNETNGSTSMLRLLGFTLVLPALWIYVWISVFFS